MRTRGFRRVLACGLLASAAVVAACSTQSSNTATKGSDTSAAAGATGVQTSNTPTTAWMGNQPGVQHEEFKYGPVKILPGQNNIDTKLTDIPKPAVDGWIVGITPDLKRPDGTIPGVDVVHLHHGVWLNLAHKDPTSPYLPERFFASGEEKTAMTLPNGFGYEYKASDQWVLNFMLHNLLEKPDEVFITYKVDFVPADSPLAKDIKPAHPVWMDVENGKIYPVFDALKGSGTNGIYTYPDDAGESYTNRPAPAQRGPRGRGGASTTTTEAKTKRLPNEWEVDRDLVVLGTGGHLHPGGLYTDLFVTREGASAQPGSDAASEVKGNKAHLFRSEAIYYEPAGAVSWDVSMTVSPADWKVRLKKGDVLSMNTTYDTKSASWYESMGINVTWVANAEDVDAAAGKDPFEHKVAVKGEVTHGHLPENDNHGGGQPELPNMLEVSTVPKPDEVKIADFVYAPGDMGQGLSVPVVPKGESLRFTNYDDKATPVGLWHTITACQAPCNKSTGIAYPLANADHQFDSGELGTGGEPTADRLDWSTPNDLPTGTYTYFCRIHPFMRGAFKVVDGQAPAGG